MRTVMLVDDERPARELLKMAIDWEKMGYEIIWEARNGQQALEQYNQRRPDLVITDVQMPVMDGLQLLKEIHRTVPSQKVVILSCHEDFSYAKQAFRYGVLDYLIKDALTEEVLFDLLTGISEEEEDGQDEEEEDRPDKPEILKLFFSEREEERAKADQAISEVLERYQEYFCFACKLEGFTGVESEWETVTAEVKKALAEEGEGDVCLLDRSVLLVAGFMQHNNSKMSMFNSRFRVLQLVRRKLELLTGCQISIGVSSSGSQAGQLKAMVKEARQALESKIFQGKGKTLYYNSEYQHHQKFQIDVLNSHFAGIRRAAENLDEEQVKKVLVELYNKNLQGVMHYNYLNYVNAILLDILSDACQGKGVPYSQVFGSDMIPLQTLDTFDTVDEMRQWFENGFHQFFVECGMDKSNYSPRICRILDYIHGNFQQDISLETIADMFWLHKVYLAKIFKQETGKSVNEYIRCLRIEKAKEMLCQEDVRINEIVDAAGFNNPQSFYTIFKKYVGMNPGQFRDRFLSGGGKTADREHDYIKHI